MYPPDSYNYPPPAPVQKIVPGQWYTAKVEPMAFWRSRITVPGHRNNAAARDLDSFIRVNPLNKLYTNRTDSPVIKSTQRKPY